MFSYILYIYLDYKEGQNCTVKYKQFYNINVIGSLKKLSKMDSFEINKIIAAILLVALLVIGIGKLSDIIFYVEKPKTPGYVVKIEQASLASDISAEQNDEKIDIAALMAMGDVTSGEKIFKRCSACHSIVKGGK